jgi:hypothetical protein
MRAAPIDPLSHYQQTAKKLAQYGLGPLAVADQRAEIDAARYAAFQKRYRLDPVAFARECIDWRGADGLATYQEDVLRNLIERGRSSAVGPHGLGKTTTMAVAILWFALTRDGDDWKIPTTASVWRQLEEFLWPEIHKWARRLRWDRIGREPFIAGKELLDLSLNLRTGSAFALASDKPSSLEGAHADHILYVFDESKAIETATFDAAEGAFSTPGEIMALAVSTPGDSSGRFWEIHAKRDLFSDWAVRAVTLEECVAAGRISMEWAKKRKEQWGEDNPEYIRRVLGRFAMADSPDGVIPRRWVQLAQMRYSVMMAEIEQRRRAMPPLAGRAVDVGGENPTGDATVIAERRGNIIMPLDVRHGMDTMALASLLHASNMTERGWIRVDAIGIGAGVVARLRQLGVSADAWQAGGGPPPNTDTSKLLEFANLRAWAWWHMRELLDPLTGAGLALPPDKDMEDELCAPSWHSNASDRIVVEDKKQIRKRLGRSPDRADAVVMAFAGTGPAGAPAATQPRQPQPTKYTRPVG